MLPLKFNKVKEFKNSVINATKGIDKCEKCRNLRKQIVEHAKAGHPDEN